MAPRIPKCIDKTNIIPKICGSLAPILIPPIHIGILWYFWSQYSRHVDKINCSCSCWDTVFKGTYESGVASYKHLYFNATENTLKIWVITVCAILLLYECTKHLISLMIQRKLRYSMAVLFISSIFAHYYSWWGYLNYYNDEFYSQWNHQLFFTLTEILSSALVLHLASSDNIVTSRKTLPIVGIAVIHIFASGGDQFVFNVIQGQGYSHQVVRDLCFMVPDMLHVVLPMFLLRRTILGSQIIRNGWLDNKLRKEILGMTVLITLGFFFCSVL